GCVLSGYKEAMSTASIRERLREIRLRTTKSTDSTGRTGDVDKENSVATLPTGTRFVTAPLPRTNAVDENDAMSVVPTPSMSRPSTTGDLASSRIQGRPHRHRPLSVVEYEKDSTQGGKSSSQKQQERVTNAEHATPSVLLSSQRREDHLPPSRSLSACDKRDSHLSSSNGKHVLVNGRPYLLIDLLGKGGSSKVYQVLDETRKKCRAVKFVDLSEADSATKEAYLNEIKLLLELKDSGCVVQLFDYELRGSHLYMVMEKGDTDLATFLKTRRSKIDHIFIRFYWSEMLKCVHAIHSKGVVHSDLKPANFLLIGGNLKLIDFGIASSIPSNRTSIMKDSQMGTLSYMPPEALAGAEPQHGKEVYKVRKKWDVWSLGCILYNMVYGRTPYQHVVNCVQKINAIIHKPVEFGPIDDKELLDVMKKCLTKDPKKRAAVEELQMHPYLQKGMESLDESAVFKDDNYLLKVAEDLRSCTPRTSARKLRNLMQKRYADDDGNSTMKIICLLVLINAFCVEANDERSNDPNDALLSRIKRQFWYANDYGGFYAYNSARLIALIVGVIALTMCCLLPCICIIGIWFAGWFGIREARKRGTPKPSPEIAVVHEPVKRGYAIPTEERTEAIVYETKQRDRYFRRSPSPRGFDDYTYYKSSRL
uniref:Protein kinase domain-containing protein n=1 Tax=Parascaris univalens TaxID=6257 RepID=A0A915BW06_PARUN